MTVCAETVEGYLQQYGWLYQKLGQDRFQTGWTEEERHFQLQIRLSETFVHLTVELFKDMHFEWDRAPDLTSYVLKVNRDLRMVKLLINDEGVVILCCDLQRLSLSYDQWEEALGIVGYYANLLYCECLKTFCHYGLPTRGC